VGVVDPEEAGDGTAEVGLPLRIEDVVDGEVLRLRPGRSAGEQQQEDEEPAPAGPAVQRGSSPFATRYPALTQAA
jgi:hypothetical protein